MREILFRGYSKDEEKWVYGCLTLNYTIIDKCGNEWQVETGSIGQYTGFRDINGDRIFEGDIIATPDGGFIPVDDIRDIFTVFFEQGRIAAHSYKVE